MYNHEGVGTFAPRYRFGLPRAGSRKSVPFPVDWEDDSFSIGLFVPMIGVAGIWGPSCIACATLAAEEINQAGGILGREVKIKCFNASDEVEDLAQITRELVDSGSISAIVGMHTSSVRRAVIEGCRGRLPYVYTALHEGGERSPGVCTIGETPDRQLRPVIEVFIDQWKARRWMFIGNDYEWPWVTHGLARSYVQQSGGVVLSDIYVPFGVEDFAVILQQIEDTRPDAVLLSLVGQDAVDFNRAFGQAGLGHSILRLSCAVEENILLAIGAGNADNLFVSSGYFGASTDDANMSFKERYHQRFGQRAPTLNSLGQSNYEGIHFAAALALKALERGDTKPLEYKGVRGIRWRSNSSANYPIHLARAEGHQFHVVKSF
jgi:ABC-type branched-subunit amino acid transport system substrate-binding protein